MAKDKTINWTAAQRLAIETVGRDVLVTASAGTGKTAVLSRRAVERIVDPADAARADSLLVLTFTDAAAEEMRSRIAETLAEQCRHSSDARLRQQLLLLNRAWISTIHAFCKRVLTEFFYLTDLDPAFGILDSDEQRLLKAEVLEETLEEAWSEEPTAQGLNILFDGRRIAPGTGSFVDRIIPLSGVLDSVVSRKDFYARADALNDLGHTANNELRNSQKNILLHLLALCRDRLDFAVTLDGRLCGGAYATVYVQSEILPAVETARALLEHEKFDQCRRFLCDLEFSQLRKPRGLELCDGDKEQIKGLIDKAKAELKCLRDAALLADAYERTLAPQAGLQTKVLLNLLRLFDANYTRAKQRRNVLDFADLEHRMLALLQTQPQAAEKLRQRFDYVFIDEYQDINAVQQRILDLFAKPGCVFVVGDIKQSIYAFRQSKPDIFLRRLDDALDIAKISTRPGRVDLRENFRCRREVIDFVNVLFGRIMTKTLSDMDYDDRAALVCGFDYPEFAADGPAEPVEMILLDEESNNSEPAEDCADDSQPDALPTMSISSAQRQAAWIAQRIGKMVGAQTGRAEFQILDKAAGAMRDVRYGDIVILMRSLSQKAQQYVEILRLAGIPVSSQSACGYFEAAEIADCLCLLKVLDNPDRDIELAALLRSPIFGFSDTHLAEIRLHSGKVRSFYNALRNYAKSGHDAALKENCAKTLSQIGQWRTRVRSGSLADLLDDIFRQKGLFAFYAAMPNGNQRCANLHKLHDHAIRFEHFRTTEPGSALTRFVEFLEKLTDQQQDWAPAEPDNGGEDAVRIMSVHKSKGLEFPVVFVAELNTLFNMRDTAGECLISENMLGLQIPSRSAGASFPSMAHQVIAHQQRRTGRAEEMRILYVALTRAREKLILTASRKESACIALLEQCALFGSTIPDWKLDEIRCHLDWLLAALANQPALRHAFDLPQNAGLAADARFHVERINADRLNTITTEILQSKRALKSITEPAANTDSTIAAQLLQTVRGNVLWRYSHEAATQIGAKCSVSDLIGGRDASDQLQLHQAFTVRPRVRFDLPQSNENALTVGSAYHLLLEHLDLSTPVNAAAAQCVLAQLTAEGKLTAAQAQAVDAAAVAAFFESELVQTVLSHHKNVFREWPFTYALDASELSPDAAGETVILQGIVDMLIVTDAGLVLIDFKTDRVGLDALGQRSEHYAKQLRLYARAACAILDRPLQSAWLYFLSPRRAVQVQASG